MTQHHYVIPCIGTEFQIDIQFIIRDFHNHMYVLCSTDSDLLIHKVTLATITMVSYPQQ